MNREKKQETKLALVTGGARRIGASIVNQLHATGYNVVIHCHHSVHEAHSLATKLNTQRANSALVLQQELTESNAAEVIINAATSWAGRLDLLVNNASVFTHTKLDEFIQADWNILFDIHVKVPFLLSLAARPWLEKQAGVIINITDIHAIHPLNGYSVYCQSKAALTMQTKSLAREFAPKIRVNAVAPGAIMWPEHENTLTSEQQAKIIAQTPLKKHGDPKYIAQAVVALAENPFITGQILHVDGGRGI